jgi:hypothetical protein
MKAERYFYSAAALVMLAITVAGFQPYYLGGAGMGGRRIAPELFTLVLVHAIALTGWMVLFVLVVVYVGACHFAVSDTWSYLSAAVLKT